MKRALIRAALTAALCLLTSAAIQPPTLQPAQAAPKAPGKLETDAKDPQVFRYKNKPGVKQVYQSTVTQTMKVDAKGAPVPVPPGGITTTFDATMVNTTDKVLPDGGGVVATTYEKLDLKLSQGGQTVPTDMLKPQIEQFKKIKTTATISPRGEKSSTTIENAPAGQAGGPLQDALVGSSIIFPEQGIKIGEKWEQKIPLEMKQGFMTLKLSFKIDYTFLGYTKLKDRRVAVFQTEIYMLLLDQDGGMPGHKVEMTGSGKGSGYIYFDQKDGLVAHSDVEMTQQIQTSIAAENQPPQTISMEISTAALMDLQQVR